MKSRLSVVLVLCVVLTACDFAKSARDSIAGAKGFIEQAQRNHLTECRADPSKPLCQAINRAVAAQNAAIDAVTVYCSGSPAWETGGPCVANKNAEAKARAAVRDLDRIIADLKGVLR